MGGRQSSGITANQLVKRLFAVEGVEVVGASLPG